MPLEKDHWDSKNVKDWIIRSEATYFVKLLKVIDLLNMY